MKKLLCGFNLFITNATQALLSSSEVSLYYRLRWQIELLFKIWKSILAIDKVGQMNIFRFECYLYGKFIALLISHQIQAFLRDSFACDPDIAIELSEWKAMKYLKKNECHLSSPYNSYELCPRLFIENCTQTFEDRAKRSQKTTKSK